MAADDLDDVLIKGGKAMNTYRRERKREYAAPSPLVHLIKVKVKRSLFLFP